MNLRQISPILVAINLLAACGGGGTSTDTVPEMDPNSYQKLIANYGQYSISVFIDTPDQNGPLDVLLIFHGTTLDDAVSITQAESLLVRTKGILERKDLVLISVAYKEENILMGDDTKEAEAVLLWTKQFAAEELGIEIDKIYLMGHSRGGYLVTRLNTMHPTNGVISSAPGPINLVYRCRLEEQGTIQPGEVCNALNAAFGSTIENPVAYKERSLLNFASQQQSKSLFVQGLEDSQIQLNLFPQFIDKLNQCTDCATFQVVEITGAGHSAMFDTFEGIDALNNFLRNN